MTANDTTRLRKIHTRLPEGHVRFQTKPQIAISQLKRTLQAGHVSFDWIVADALYGHDGPFLDALQDLSLRYVVAVAGNTRLWPKAYTSEIRPWLGSRVPTVPETQKAARTVSAIAADVPADAWRVIHLREGAKGPLAFEFARVRAWAIRRKKPGPPVWLMIRRTLGRNPEYQYFVSNADESTPLETLALVGATRFRVEEFFEESKGALGMTDNEARGWNSWHHHMSLVALAHLFVSQTRRDLQAEVPELTLPMAMELVRSALQRSRLSEDDAIRLTEYHLQRNRTARQSHRKSWLQKNKEPIPEPLL